MIEASKFKNGKAAGSVEIQGHTKHGTTAVVSVLPPEKLAKGDVLKTKKWILGTRELRVVGTHDKPMKLPGDWYEVQIIAMPEPKKKSGPKPKTR
jgi:hypothetical protein